MSKLVDLGGFSLNRGMVMRQLKQDLHDNWYPDPIHSGGAVVSSKRRSRAQSNTSYCRKSQAVVTNPGSAPVAKQ